MSTYISSNANPAAPVESKVKAGTIGAGVGVVAGQVLNWLVDMYAITPGTIDGNPAVVQALITGAVAAGLAFVGGYVAKHSPRPAKPAVPPVTPATPFV